MGVESWATNGPVVHRAAEPTRRRVGGTAAASDYYVSVPAGGRHPNGRAPSGTPTRDSRTTVAARHRVQRPETSRRGGGPLGDKRGLTAAGELVLLLVFGGVGALLDRAIGHGLWVFFSVGFVAAVLLGAWRIHLEDLAASIVMVPLTYAVIASVSGLLAEVGSGSNLRQLLTSAAGVMVFGAPILVLSLGVAILIAAARARAATVARRRARARAARRYGALPPGSRPRRRSADTTRR